MIYLDGFSGYGGFHKGLEDAGFHFDEVYFSEIDKYAIANYSYNYPKSKYAGSIIDVSRRTIPHIDIFTFGWPCQDNSIAGKRKGQSGGTRSGLLYEAVRIIDEFKPRLFIAENVEGLFSVNGGADYIESLRVLSIFSESLPQYDIEMQLLNTRWVLPQNRERLFFIGHLRGSGSRQIFPIGENDSLCDRPRKDTEEVLQLAQTLTARQFASWNGNYVEERGISVIGNIYPSTHEAGNIYDKDGISPTIKCNGPRPNSKNVSPKVVTEAKIRRLTPIECERLQGLPDNWTKYGMFDGQVKEISDTQRYKLCGNGVSVPIIELIGRKLLENNPNLF